MLVKHLAYEWYVQDDKMGERLVEWLQKHWHWDAVKNAMEGAINFKLCFEEPPENCDKEATELKE